jgi:copper chaperone
MSKLTFEITGMTCGHCVAAVDRTLKGLDGVSTRDVKIGSAEVEFDESRLSSGQIAQAIADEGYVVVGTR